MNSNINANIHFSFSLLLLTSKSAAETLLPRGLIKMLFSSDSEGNSQRGENCDRVQYEIWEGSSYFFMGNVHVPLTDIQRWFKVYPSSYSSLM